MASVTCFSLQPCFRRRKSEKKKKEKFLSKSVVYFYRFSGKFTAELEARQSACHILVHYITLIRHAVTTPYYMVYRSDHRGAMNIASVQADLLRPWSGVGRT